MQLNGIYSDIYRRLASDDALFPALPETAVKLHGIMEQPHCEIRLVAKIVQVDAGLAAFLMQCANSLRYYTRVAPQDLECAIRRIGLKETGNFAVSYFCRSTFQGNNSRVSALLRKAYADAVRVASLSSLLAAKSGVPQGKAMLAGLLQDIGLPPTLNCIAQTKPHLLDDQDLLDQALDQLCPLVSATILQKWRFDDELLGVVRSRKDWYRDQGPADLADLVLIARLHAAIGTPDFSNCPPLIKLPAFAKLDLGELTPDNSLQMVAESRDEIEEIRSLLGS
ncbi:MAG: HDOD domain-containing protein [Gammaproteobacteria bacterium]|nr:HDOD domain-containing protein [Gammaproteobacteria bacterium]